MPPRFGGELAHCRLPPRGSGLGFSTIQIQKRREARPRLHSVRNRWGGEFPGPPFLVSSLSCRPRPPDRKPKSELARRAGYIRRLSVSPRPLRRPPLRRLATSPRPGAPPAPPLRPGAGSREAAAAPRQRRTGPAAPHGADMAAAAFPAPGLPAPPPPPGPVPA